MVYAVQEYKNLIKYLLKSFIDKNVLSTNKTLKDEWCIDHGVILRLIFAVFRLFSLGWKLDSDHSVSTWYGPKLVAGVNRPTICCP